MLDETDLAILEIKKDAFDFQREILIGGENSRTGKIEAERIIKYREEKIKQKEAMIKKFQTKKDNLIHQVNKIIAQIKKKDELGDDLKFIDFHQLQIENKKYLKEIEDKNSKLLKTKVSTGRTIKQWNELKKDLNKEMEDKKFYLTQIKKAKETKKEVMEMRNETKGKLDSYKNDVESLKEQITKLEKEGSMNIKNFIDDKVYQNLLHTKTNNYERKIQIMTLKYRYALKQLGLNEDDCLPEIKHIEDLILNKDDTAPAREGVTQNSSKGPRANFLTPDEAKIINLYLD